MTMLSSVFCCQSAVEKPVEIRERTSMMEDIVPVVREYAETVSEQSDLSELETSVDLSTKMM